MRLNSLGFSEKPKNCRIVVAMSGGVDSSVTAALLKNQGYDVVGVTLQLYDNGEISSSGGTCCAGIDIYDARKVADKIKIPHYVLDYETNFKKSVIDDFADEYLLGRTPIPCVKCNQTVKFKDLLKFSKDLGAKALATGHYVQRKVSKNSLELHKGVDEKKDQSYFLFATTKEQLSYLRFPIGGMTKNETRDLAKKFNLSVKDKPDSQDICFVPNGNYANIVSKLRPESIVNGEIVHIDGTILGKHDGIINYTVGQRKGIGIGGRKNVTEDRLYVIDIDPKNYRVYVGPKNALKVTKIFLNNVNIIEKNNIYNNEKIYVKLRNTGKLIPAKLFIENGIKILVLEQPEEGISPGQAAVFYDKNYSSKVLGGGWISKTEKVKKINSKLDHSFANL